MVPPVSQSRRRPPPPPPPRTATTTPRSGTTTSGTGTTSTTRSTTGTTTASTGTSTSTRPVGFVPDRVETRTASAAERQVLRDATRVQGPVYGPPAPRGVQARSLATQPPDTPAMRDALAAQDKLKTASDQLRGLELRRTVDNVKDALGMTSNTPAQDARLEQQITVAKREVATARTAANAATNAAMAEVNAPARTAIRESATAQQAASTANAAADAASRAVTGLQMQRAHLRREDPKADVSSLDQRITQAQAEAATAREAANTANRTAVEAGDRAVAAQQTANTAARRLGREPPFPAAEGLQGTAGATQLSATDQRAVLGAPAGMSTTQARQVGTTQATERAQAAVASSAVAQEAARDAQAGVTRAEQNLAGAQRARTDAQADPSSTPDQRRAAQQAVTQAEADLRTAQSRFNQADRAARTAGDEAIAAQQAANRSAGESASPKPFPAAEGLRDTVDAASLPEAQQRQVLGGTSTITQQQALEADLQQLRTGSVQQRAAALEAQMKVPSTPEYRQEFLRQATPDIQQLGQDVRNLPPEGRDRATAAVSDSVNRAMQAAGPDGARAVQEAYARGVAGGAPTASDIRNIVNENDPVKRNQLITQGYHDLSNQTADLLGRDNANWLTFGQYASATAGRGIRGDMPMNAVEDKLGGLGGVDQGEIKDGLADGNKKIFSDIAPHFQEFNQTFLSDPSWRTDPARGREMLNEFKKDVPETLRPAFDHYYEAMRLNAGPHTPETDRQRAQLIYRANVEVAAHEQKLADTEVKRAVPDGNLAGDVVSHIPIIGGGGDVAEVATDRLAIDLGTGGTVPLSQDVAREPPPDLRTLDDPDGYFNRVSREWNDGKGINDRGHSDANNWRNYDERMGFIMHMFRGYQQQPGIFNGPPGVHD